MWPVSHLAAAAGAGTQARPGAARGRPAPTERSFGAESPGRLCGGRSGARALPLLHSPGRDTAQTMRGGQFPAREKLQASQIGIQRHSLGLSERAPFFRLSSEAPQIML